MINSKELYFRARNYQNAKRTRTNNQLLEEVYLGKIISEMYECIVKSAINDNKYKATYTPSDPIPVRHKYKIEERFAKSNYEIKFMKDTTGQFILHMVINCEKEEYKKEIDEDKILKNTSKIEVYNILKQFYTKFNENTYQKILDDIRLNHPSFNNYGYNYTRLFGEIEVLYNNYYRNIDGIKMRKIFQANGYDKLFQIGALSYDTDIEDKPDAYANKYVYYYNYLERYRIIQRDSDSPYSSPMISLGRILQDYISCNKSSIYDPLLNKMYYINENLSQEDTNKCITLLLKGLYKAEAVFRIIKFIQTFYAHNFTVDEDLYSLRREMPINEEMRKKYEGLSDDIIRHLYFSTSGPNRLLILERSPEVSTKSNYDRLRIQFSILGVKNRKKYLEDNKEEILKYVIDKASKNKYFKKVPINCFAVTRIGMNDSGDVTIIMELKQELLNLDKKTSEE